MQWCKQGVCELNETIGESFLTQGDDIVHWQERMDALLHNTHN